MTDKDTIACWGAITCGNVWAAADQRPIAWLIAAVWLAFAALIVRSSDRATKAQGGEHVE